ncbi:hypothetical protein U1Q18_006245 [Sarracenia purpurea var. burkii]
MGCNPNLRASLGAYEVGTSYCLSFSRAALQQKSHCCERVNAVKQINYMEKWLVGITRFVVRQMVIVKCPPLLLHGVMELEPLKWAPSTVVVVV